MAIYNNREVTVMGPTHHAQQPETLRIRYADGSEETVGSGKVMFTEEEKKNFIKAYPSRFDNVRTASDEDVKAVRLGATPPSSPEFQSQAEAQARSQKVSEVNRQNLEKARKDADKKVQDELNRPVIASAPMKMHGDNAFATVETDKDKAKK